MTLKLRKMHPYYPRKRRSKKECQKQALHDLQHRLASSVGAFLVLLKEGSAAQVQESQRRAKDDFLKLADEIHKFSQPWGQQYSRLVERYLHLVALLLDSQATLIAPAMIYDCHQLSEQLVKELRAA